MCLAGNEEENEGDRGSKVTTNKFGGKAELKGGQRNRIQKVYSFLSCKQAFSMCSTPTSAD